MQDQPNGDLLLRINACLAYTDPYERQALDLPPLIEMVADPETFSAQTAALVSVQSQFLMSEDLFDMDAIWRRALLDHTPLPDCEACVALYERYSPTSSAPAEDGADGTDARP